jgi:hypothetical protein
LCVNFCDEPPWSQADIPAAEPLLADFFEEERSELAFELVDKTAVELGCLLASASSPSSESTTSTTSTFASL